MQKKAMFGQIVKNGFKICKFSDVSFYIDVVHHNLYAY